MDWLLTNWSEVVLAVGGVVLAARALLVAGSLIVKLTPTTADDDVVTSVGAFVDRVVSLLKVVGLHVKDK